MISLVGHRLMRDPFESKGGNMRVSIRARASSSSPSSSSPHPDINTGIHQFTFYYGLLSTVWTQSALKWQLNISSSILSPVKRSIMRMAENKAAILRRNKKGICGVEFCEWPDEPFEEMDSTVAVQQFIQQSIRKDSSRVEEILEPPEGQEEGAWKYEHLRQFCMELNRLAVKLQKECNPSTCSQMTATEQWIFLCAAHKTPKECPAIDYTRHTLDGAACLLNSNKYFPSRVTIKESSVAKLGSVCRRVYRIFSHAFFHHRPIFDEFETQTHLCRRFTLFVTKYNLMSKDNLIVPIQGLPAFADSSNATSTPSESSSQT